MAKAKLTAGRIAGFQCPEGKAQAFLWCAEVQGLAVRATSGSTRKRYIFESKVKGKTVRLTIGEVSVWSIADAQAEARRLQTLIDQGHDPRQVKAEVEAAKVAAQQAKKAEADALVMQEIREAATLGMAWPEYITAMKPAWGALHLHDHIKAMQAGGEKRTRSHKLTAPGALASLATVRLVDLTPELVTEWAKVEGAKRPARARNARTLLSTFLNWCAAHPTYKAIVTGNAAQSKEAKKHLGKPQKKNDALQREQLPAWFAAVKQIGNPAISAYAQAMLLTGARPNELITVRWADVDFQWNSMTIKDKVEGLRVIPLTPYVAHLIAALPRRNEWVFSSLTAASGHLVEPRIAHDKACAVAGVDVTLHGLPAMHCSACAMQGSPIDSTRLKQAKHRITPTPPFTMPATASSMHSRIRQSGFLGLDNYTSIEQFGSTVENYLLAQLDHYFPANAVPSAFERGNAAHAGFRFHRLQNFLPRRAAAEALYQITELAKFKHPKQNQARRRLFSSPTAASGHLVEPRIAHDKACAVAGLDVTLHGLRRSFASLCEWIEMPAGIGAQIQGHKPQGVREQHYIRRPLDLLRVWHVKIEAWILKQAGIRFVPSRTRLRAVK